MRGFLWFITGLALALSGEVYAQVCDNGDCSIDDIVLADTTVRIGPNEGDSATFDVVVSTTDCLFLIRNQVPWITQVAGNSDEFVFLCTAPTSGNRMSVSLTAAANPNLVERSSLLRVGGRTLTVIQDPKPCAYTDDIDSPITIPFQGAENGVYQVTVTTGCDHFPRVEDENGDPADWVTFTFDDTPTTSGDDLIYDHTYTVAENQAADNRTAFIRVYDGPDDDPDRLRVLEVELIQDPAICEFSLSDGAFEFSAEEGSQNLTLTTETNCTWDIRSTGGADWVSVSPSADSGIRSISIQVTANDGPQPRTETFEVFDRDNMKGAEFTVTQEGCTYAITPELAEFASSGDTSIVTVITTSGCPWTIGETPDWVNFVNVPGDRGTQEVTYIVAPNDGFESRTALVEIAGKQFRIVQEGCNYDVTPTTLQFTGEGGQGEIAVTTQNDCGWLPTTEADWIQIINQSPVSGNGTARFSVAGNFGNQPRSATIAIGDQEVRVDQGTNSVFVFESASYDAWERNGGVDVTLLRTGLNNESVSVDLVLSEGTASAADDYLATTQRVDFPAGSVRETVTIPFRDDSEGEDDETFTARLSNPSENATLGDLIESEITILDMQPPIVDQVFFTHPDYGRREPGARFAVGDAPRLHVDAHDQDALAITGITAFAGDREIEDEGFEVASNQIGNFQVAITVRDVEGNSTGTSASYSVAARPAPPELSVTSWQTTRSQPFSDTLESGLYYDFNKAGHVTRFGNEAVPIIANLGTFDVRVFRYDGTPGDNQTLILSEPVTIPLTVVEDEVDPFRYKSLLPWFSHRLDGGTIAGGDFGFTSVLSVNNTGNTAARVRVSVRRGQASGEDRGALRVSRIYQVPANTQLFLDAENDGFIEDLANPHLNRGRVWSADGSGMAVWIESDSSFVTSGFATYAGSREDKSSTASPAQTDVPDLTSAASRIVFNTLPVPGEDAFTAVVIANTTGIPTRARLSFYDEQGLVRERQSGVIAPYAPLAVPIDGQDLGRQGFVVVEALEEGAELVGTSFLFNELSEPAMAGATPFPDAGGPTRFYLPWVSFNLNGGTGLNGDFAFRSEITVNNLSEDPVTLTFAGKRGNGQTFSATRQLGGLRHGAFDAQELFGLDDGFGLAITLDTSDPMVGVNYVTFGGRHNLPDKSAEKSPSQSNAATFQSSGKQLVFSLVNDAARPEIVPAVVLMNVGPDPVQPTLRVVGVNGEIKRETLAEAIQPGAPFVVLFAEQPGEGRPGELAIMAAPRAENFFVAVDGDQPMTGSTFLNAPSFLETAIALAPSTNKVKLAQVSSPAIVQGDTFSMRVSCPACDEIQFDINGSVFRRPISAEGIYEFSSDEYGLIDRVNDARPGVDAADRGVYPIRIQPVLGPDLIDEVTEVPLLVDVRQFFPDDTFYQAILGSPVSRANLLSKFNVRIENETLDLSGIERLTNLFTLQMINVTNTSERHVSLDLSTFEILQTLEISNTEGVLDAGIRHITLPHQELLQTVTLKNLNDMESISFADDLIADQLTEFASLLVEDCPNFVHMDLKEARLNAVPLIQGRNCPLFHCLELPRVRTRQVDLGDGQVQTELAPIFADLNNSGFLTLDNEGCGLDSQFSLFQQGVEGDFIIVNTLEGDGCTQGAELHARDVFILEGEDGCTR